MGSQNKMTDLRLEPNIKNEIIHIAKSYGFTNIQFDTQLPYEGFRRNLASTYSPENITYRYLFLNPAIRFYSIDSVLFQKATKILTLHEKTHHMPPFNSNYNIDDYLVQKQVSKEYNNPQELLFLDILTTQFMRVQYLNADEMTSEVSEHIKKYFWIEQNIKELVLEQLSKKENYKPKNLKKILGDRKIIPESKSLLKCLSG